MMRMVTDPAEAIDDRQFVRWDEATQSSIVINSGHTFGDAEWLYPRPGDYRCGKRTARSCCRDSLTSSGGWN